MKTTMMRSGVWAVMLTATDGRVCRWEFKGCTLTHVKDLIRGYVESCPYDCDWTIRGGGMTIRGKSRQDDWGHTNIRCLAGRHGRQGLGWQPGKTGKGRQDGAAGKLVNRKRRTAAGVRLPAPHSFKLKINK